MDFKEMWAYLVIVVQSLIVGFIAVAAVVVLLTILELIF